MKNNLKKYVMIGVMSLVAVALVFLGIYCYKQNKKIKVNSVDEVKAEVVVKAEVTAEIMSDVFKVEDFFDNKKTEKRQDVFIYLNQHNQCSCYDEHQSCKGFNRQLFLKYEI